MGCFPGTRIFPPIALSATPGQAWYSPRILGEAERRQLTGGRQPAHIPSLAESREFWRYRDAAPSIPQAVRHCTNLAVIVYANERDHVQAAPDHGHILIQLEGFRQANARFARLNPDRSYVEWLAANRPGSGLALPDNPAGKAFNRGNIGSGLEPAHFPPQLYMQAAVCELADRTHARQWAANLDAVLYPAARRY